MADRPRIVDMPLFLRERRLPSITLWNRLEGRPRRADFDRVLRAEVRDALWMLTRQWQMGEFLGDDAGSPVAAKVRVGKTRLTKYRPFSGDPVPYPDAAPIEAVVESRPVPYEIGGEPVAFDLRLMIGRRWLQLVRRDVGDFDAEFIDTWGVQTPDPDDPAHAAVVAHPEVWAYMLAAAGRAVDGWRLYMHLTVNPANRAHDGTAIPAGQHGAIDALVPGFLAWVEQLFYRPAAGEGEAWRPDRLEYQFSVSAPEGGDEAVFIADEYYNGRLD